LDRKFCRGRGRVNPGKDDAAQIGVVRRPAASHPGKSYPVETDPVGGSWTTPVGSETITALGPQWERVVWVSHETLTPGEAVLFRLPVTEP